MTLRSSVSHQVRVGLFIGLGILIIFVSLFLVSNGRLFKRTVTLHAHFDNVQGLSEGSLVSLAGIHVGNVTKFEFNPDENKLDVQMKVDSEYLSRITEDSYADIRTQGALGDKYIYIVPGSSNQKPLKDGDQLNVAPSTDLMTVISQKSGDVKKVFEILDEIHRFTKALNADNRSEIMMKNFSEASQDLKVTAKEARELIADLRSQDSKKINSAVDKLDRILTKIDRGEGTLGALINDPSLHESLKSMVGAPDKKKSIKSLIRLSIEKPEK